jgi:curved DNA-binding protein CbpA
MFVDYYEILEVSPNANAETIDRIFRHLAMRYHPDNKDTGNIVRFQEVVEAHDALKDPINRARYDVQHKGRSGLRVKLAEEVNTTGIEDDGSIQDKVLRILLVKRRRDIKDPGIGSFELARLLDLPPDHLEFHLWYLKGKGWIGREEDGTLAITVDGVEHCNSKHSRETSSRQLTHAV